MTPSRGTTGRVPGARSPANGGAAAMTPSRGTTRAGRTVRRGRFVLAAALAAAALAAVGCAGVTRVEPEAREAGRCRDAEYRGGYTAAGKTDPATFKMSARLCGDGAALLEFRGAIGGPALVAGVHPGKDVRLLFPGRRVAVDGPDDASFWRRWTGAAIDGGLIAQLGAGGVSSAAGWRAVVDPPGAGETLPAGLRASGPGGDRIELRKVKERPAPSGSVWPAIPANFALKPADGAFEE